MARRKKQNEDKPQENLDSSDDNFGLPEIEYEPLKREAAEEDIVSEDDIVNKQDIVSKEDIVDKKDIVTKETTEPQPETLSQEEQLEESHKVEEQVKEEYVEDNQFYEPSYSYSRPVEKPSVWPKILGFLAILLVAIGAVWYFASYRPKQLAAEAKERRESLAIQEEARKKETERLAEQQRIADEQRNTAAAAAIAVPTPTTGSIETLSGRSGRYYVVVASSIDGDLVMDYAKKLSSKGVTTKIIPPFGKSKFHRLTVAEGDTYANAQATADGLKSGEYGDKVWVIKY